MQIVHSLRRTIVVLTALAAFGSMASCGDDSTGPEGTGTVSAVVTDEPASAAAATRSATATAQGSFSGTFQGQVQIQISTDGEEWVDLGSPGSVSVALQSGSETTVQGEVEVVAGDYTHVRIVMSGASASLDAGAVLGGAAFSSAVDVQVAGGSEVTVEREVFPFRVDSETSMVVVVDLNSEAWISSQSAESGSAAAGEVQSAVTVESRAG